MNDDEFFAHLQALCADAIETYRAEYPDTRSLIDQSYEDTGERLENHADLYDCFAELTQFYDELFAVDSTPYRETWREHIVYDCTLRDRLTQLTSDLPASLSLVLIGGRYSSRTGYIGVSPNQRPPTAAYGTLTSEVAHAYQHRFDSPTWTHPYLIEGLEQAASTCAIAHLAATHDVLVHSAKRKYAQTLLGGVLAHGTRRGGITPETVRDLGVPEDELADFRAHILKRPFGSIWPRHRWSDLAFFPEYVLFGSMLLVSERLGVSRPLERAFHGEHPWTSIIEEITAYDPGWLWRRYRQ
jgi:hypothetical protein